MSGALSLKPSYYEALKRLTLELAGINLGSDHAFLIETRLRALARQEGFSSLLHMVEELFSQGQARLALQVVSSLLERDTHFNSDKQGMEHIEKMLMPDLMNRFSGQVIRILSFGCSSGQEAYSVAMQVEKIREKFPHLSCEITGIDYPSPALARAETGKYTHFEVQRGLPIRDLVTHFDRMGEDWVIKPEIRKKIMFKEYHLLSNLTELGHFHLILFQNSLSYYSSVAQIRVVRSLSSITQPNGYLMLGSGEKIPRISYGFEPIPDAVGIFKKQRARAPGDEPEEEISLPETEIQSERLTMLENEIHSRREANPHEPQEFIR